MKPPASANQTVAYRLDQLASVFAGASVARDDQARAEGELLPAIGIRDLADGMVPPVSWLEPTAFPDPRRTAQYGVAAGDVLVTARGSSLKFAIVGTEAAGAIATSNIIVIRPNPSAVGGALYAILSSDVFRPRIDVLRRGATTQLSLSAKDVARLEISLPPLEEQHRIAALVHESHAAYCTAIEAAELRRTLARRLMDARLFGTNHDH